MVNLRLALKHLAKQRLYALINIVGLALGLGVFLFSTLVVSYEKNHDHMFPQRGHIFTVGSVFAATSGESIREYPNARLAYAPLFAAQIKAAQRVVRSVHREQVLSVNNHHYYQSVRFTDPGFTRLFDFKYLHGNRTALDDPHRLIITATTAKKLFGRVNVLGESVYLDHKLNMQIGAVIEDVAPDSHFNSSFIPNSKLAAIASIDALTELGGFDQQSQWSTLFPNDMTYILLPHNLDKAWLQTQVNAVAARHTPAKELEYISALKVRPLIEANTQIWDSLGFPVLNTIQLLGLLVLLIACANYTNLATAQSFGRTREVGLRKTFGAGQLQLLTQFLLESLMLAAIAMLLAMSAIELVLPSYNHWTGKNLSLDYFEILPKLVLTTIIMALLAGAYPAYLITRHNPIDALHHMPLKGGKGSRFRNLMITTQFAISTFILALVMIIYFQNIKIQSFSEEFPKFTVAVLARVDRPEILEKHQTLKQQLKALPSVQNVTFSSGVPFSVSDGSRSVTAKEGDKKSAFKLRMVSVDADFISTYGIKLLAGRPFDMNIANDNFAQETRQLNLVVNQLAAQKLGFYNKGKTDNNQIIGKTFYKIADDKNPDPRQYKIIGLMPDQYFLGLHQKMPPLAFFIKPQSHKYASVRINDKNSNQTLSEIDQVWSSVISGYPIQRTWLDSYFKLFFRIPLMINQVIAIFASVALALALTGLFGLAAFMAQRRSKEIGLRKIMGASISQIVRLLIWQFSLPVIWSLLIAIPLAYFASAIYLDFFQEQISFVIPIIILASIIGILTAWCIIAIHAIHVANATPMQSLRCE